MKTYLMQWIKKIFSDLHSAIIATILFSILSGGLIFLYAKSLWNQLKIIALIPIPLWGLIAFSSLIGLLIYLILRRIHSCDVKEYKDLFITTNDLKWNLYLVAGNSYRLSKKPYCVKHDILLYKKNGRFTCYGTDKESCPISTPIRDIDSIYKKAHILAEKKLRGMRLHLED